MSLNVRDLTVVLSGTGKDIVAGIDFDIAAGQVLGLIGESGSGKTTVAMALMDHARKGAEITAGSVKVDGREVLGQPPEVLRSLRGRLISYVPQDPVAALNPRLSIGRQLRELIVEHAPEMSATEVQARIEAALAGVSLPATRELLARRSFQLSGGQQQRICLAMAFLLRPRLVILDEPTTGLDVVTQSSVMQTIRDLCREHDTAALYVSHDLAAVDQIADQVMTMYAGRVAEVGPAADVLRQPRHPYTRRLLQATPDRSMRHGFIAASGAAPRPGHRPDGCFFAPQCVQATANCAAPPAPVSIAQGWSVLCCNPIPDGAGVPARPPAPPLRHHDSPAVLTVRGVEAKYGSMSVLHGIDFEVRPGECVAIVAESGSGKTTLARTISGLHPRSAGEILLNGQQLAPRARDRAQDQRRQIQHVFQSPFNSLNPRMSVAELIGAPCRLLFNATGAELERAIDEAMALTSLSPAFRNLRPAEISGGERQRVAIARALICKPSLLLCDEITSALDVSIQASVLSLLQDLQAQQNLSMIFVTHDLAVVRSLADRVLVLQRGEVVEQGAPDLIMTDPQHEYTRSLLAHMPTIKAA